MNFLRIIKLKNLWFIQNIVWIQSYLISKFKIFGSFNANTSKYFIQILNLELKISKLLLSYIFALNPNLSLTNGFYYFQIQIILSYSEPEIQIKLYYTILVEITLNVSFFHDILEILTNYKIIMDKPYLFIFFISGLTWTR